MMRNNRSFPRERKASMNARTSSVLAIVVVMFAGVRGFAGQPTCASCVSSCGGGSCQTCCCPDNYCPKPFPCLACVPRCCNFSPKYTRCLWPDLGCHAFPAWYKCGTAEPCCKEHRHLLRLAIL